MKKCLRSGTVGQGVETTGFFESIIETIHDGVFVADPDGTILYANEAIETFTGRERNELVGATFATLIDSELVRPDEFVRLVDSFDTLSDGTDREQHMVLETSHGDGMMVDIRLWQRVRDDGTEDIVGVLRDVTERERRLQAAERKREALSQLYETAADAGLTFDEKAQRILSIGCEYLDLPYGFLTTIDGQTQRMVRTVGDHELLQPGESAPLEESYCRDTITSDDLVGMQDARTALGEDHPAYERFGLGCYVGTKILIGNELHGTFCFASSNVRDRSFTPDEREMVKLLGQWTGYELDRQRVEDRLQGLHRGAQELLLAETVDEVARIAVEMGRDLFNRPITTCWQYDPGADVLRPLAETDECSQVLGEAPTFERGEAVVWESFDTGEVRNYGNMPEQPGAYNPETELLSEVHIPLGEHGVIISAATEPRAFDEIDTESLRLLGELVQEAMTAVERETMLFERTEALQRQNERLDEFANLVAHDLRNPLTGAVTSLEIARETNEAHFFDRVEQALERMDDLIEELLDIAHGNREEVDSRTLSLESIVDEAWSYLDAPEATLSVSADLGRIDADETRLLQLFGNLFRNCIEHAGDEVTVEVGLLPDNGGFYVADDGPGLSDDLRTDLLEHGRDSSVRTTGLGLASSRDVVEAHDWDLFVPDTDEGTRFEIRTDGQTE